MKITRLFHPPPGHMQYLITKCEEGTLCRDSVNIYQVPMLWCYRAMSQGQFVMLPLSQEWNFGFRILKTQILIFFIMLFLTYTHEESINIYRTFLICKEKSWSFYHHLETYCFTDKQLKNSSLPRRIKSWNWKYILKVAEQ